jgi:hypothetical protein
LGLGGWCTTTRLRIKQVDHVRQAVAVLGKQKAYVLVLIVLFPNRRGTAQSTNLSVAYGCSHLTNNPYYLLLKSQKNEVNLFPSSTNQISPSVTTP